jgi:hypothetical protein
VIDETIPANDDGNVVTFTGKQRPNLEDGPMLRPVEPGRCSHHFANYEVDIDGGKCKCLRCGEEITPFFVLAELMREESKWWRARATYQDQMKRLEERSRTKCQHCGEMTRVSRR